MTAKDQIAAMLNELMGPSRNQDKNLDLNFRDSDVCKFFLAGFCPHDEFVNTKADLGPCRYVHDENLRIAYRTSDQCGKLGYERQFYYFLKRIHDDMMRKIERNKERLAITQGVQEIDKATKKQLEDKIAQLKREMSDYVERAERAGSRGDLDKSQKYVKRAEEINHEMDTVNKLLVPEKQEQYTAGYKDPNAPKPMRVCEVCGSFLIIGDVQQRIDDHMQGKQHLGYAKITATMEELKSQIRDELSPERGHSPAEHRHKRHRSRSRDRTEKPHKHSSSTSNSGASVHHRSKRSRSKSHDSHRHRNVLPDTKSGSPPAKQKVTHHQQRR